MIFSRPNKLKKRMASEKSVEAKCVPLLASGISCLDLLFSCVHLDNVCVWYFRIAEKVAEITWKEYFMHKFEIWQMLQSKQSLIICASTLDSTDWKFRVCVDIHNCVMSRFSLCLPVHPLVRASPPSLSTNPLSRPRPQALSLSSPGSCFLSIWPLTAKSSRTAPSNHVTCSF
jgi:hypothetical protein